jgi:hypothetical protein
MVVVRALRDTRAVRRSGLHVKLILRLHAGLWLLCAWILDWLDLEEIEQRLVLNELRVKKQRVHVCLEIGTIFLRGSGLHQRIECQLEARISYAIVEGSEKMTASWSAWRWVRGYLVDALLFLWKLRHSQLRPRIFLYQNVMEFFKIPARYACSEGSKHVDGLPRSIGDDDTREICKNGRQILAGFHLYLRDTECDGPS